MQDVTVTIYREVTLCERLIKMADKWSYFYNTCFQLTVLLINSLQCITTHLSEHVSLQVYTNRLHVLRFISIVINRCNC